MSDNPNLPSESEKVDVSGQAIDWSDQQLDDLANINAPAILDAVQDAENYPQLDAFLKATVRGGDSA